MVPGKITLGQRTVRWYEGEVRGWLEAHRQDGKVA
jgi:predicted DNA-binding transcriptional regulator AlpA